MTRERRVLLSDPRRYRCRLSSAGAELLFLMAPYVSMDITVNHPPPLSVAMFHRCCITGVKEGGRGGGGG